MALSLATVGGKITAALYNAVINYVNPMGLHQVVPTTVSGGSVSTIGTVTFSAATTLRMQGIFSATYKSYLVLIEIETSSATNLPAFSLCSGATPDASANYDTEGSYASGASATAVASAGQTSWANGSGASAVMHKIKFDISSPFLTQATTGLMHQGNFAAAAAPAQGVSAVRHRLASSFDGLQVVASGGATITGTATVMGYNF